MVANSSATVRKISRNRTRNTHKAVVAESRMSAKFLVDLLPYLTAFLDSSLFIDCCILYKDSPVVFNTISFLF